MSVSVSRLQHDRTYYVSTTGSDNNNGLCSGQAFQTIQKAVDIASGIINNGYTITIKLANGTYTTGAILKRYNGPGFIIIQGNPVTPDSVLISTTTNAFYSEHRGAKWVIKDLKIQTSGSATNGVHVEGGYIVLQNVHFGSCSANQIWVERNGRVLVSGNYTISGGAVRHVFARFGGTIELQNLTVTLANNPAFTVFVEIQAASGAFYGLTFNGSGTGTRYKVELNGVINTFGGGANYFPGNAAGVTATGGQYN